MSLITILFYIVSSIVLFFLLNYLDNKKRDNLPDYIITTIIYILLLSCFFRSYKDNIFLVVIFQNIINIIYVSYINEFSFIKNSKYNIIKYLSNIIITYFINILFINKVDNIFLKPNEIRLLLWLVIFMYLYKKIINIKFFSKQEVNSAKFYQDKEHIVIKYAKYKNKYQNIIKSKYKDINLLLYAIMIYENSKRNEILRKIDIFFFKYFSKKCKFGIMQIPSKKLISDEESITIVSKKLTHIYTKERKGIRHVINKYYKEENDDVYNIYLTIKKFNKN